MADRFPAELPMRFTTTSDGVRIAYAVVGDGPTCIYAWGPSATHSALFWKLFRRSCVPLCERLRMVFFDWRNTGLSSSTPEGFTIEAGGRDLEAVIEAVASPEPVAIWAWAGAPYAVLPFAASHPDRVGRIAMTFAHVSGAGMPRSWLSWHELIDDEPELAVRFSAAAGLGADAPPNPVFERFLAESAPLHYQAKIERLASTLDVTEHVPDVTCPVLVVARRDSPWPTAAEAAQTAADFAQGRLWMLDGDQNYFEHSQPPEAFLDFLAGNDTRPAESHRTARCGELLSARELDVLALIAAGKTNAQIAEALTIAPGTASRHVHNILEKLGMSRRSEAAAWWAQRGS